jgi:hypothetical protein
MERTDSGSPTGAHVRGDLESKARPPPIPGLEARGRAGPSAATPRGEEAWTVVQSRRRHAGRPYFYNRVTGESRWERPERARLMSPEAEVAPSRAGDGSKTRAVETNQRSKGRASTAETSLDGLPDMQLNLIPEAFPRAEVEEGGKRETPLTEATRRVRQSVQGAVDRLLAVPYSVCSEVDIHSMCSPDDQDQPRVVITKTPWAERMKTETRRGVQFPASPKKLERYREYLRDMSPDKKNVSALSNRAEGTPSPTFSETVLALSASKGKPDDLAGKFEWSSAAKDGDAEWEA